MKSYLAKAEYLCKRQKERTILTKLTKKTKSESMEGTKWRIDIPQELRVAVKVQAAKEQKTIGKWIEDTLRSRLGSGKSQGIPVTG